MGILKKVIGSLVFLAGIWLVFFEIAMAIGESHALHDSNVFVFLFFTVLGIAMVFCGVMLVKSKKILGVLLFVFCAYLLFTVIWPIMTQPREGLCQPIFLGFLLVVFTMGVVSVRLLKSK